MDDSAKFSVHDKYDCQCSPWCSFSYLANENASIILLILKLIFVDT